MSVADTGIPILRSITSPTTAERPERTAPGAETFARESPPSLGAPPEAPLSGGFRRGLGWITALGSAVVVLDIMVFRPLCPPAKGQTGCFAVGGDALGVFSMARLLAWGKGLINPITYELAGGREAAFIGKPPALVSYLGGVFWLAERPLFVRLAIFLVVGAAVAALMRHSWNQPVRRVTEVGLPVLVVLSLLADNPTLLARVATSTVALGAIPMVGLVGRRLVDERTGLVAALLAALVPAIWVNSSMMNVETLYLLALPWVLLATLRAADRPEPARFVQLGGALLVLSFTRLEGAALVVLILGGLVVTLRTPSLARRLGLAGVALAMVAVPLAGWSAVNAARLGKNVGVSAGGGGVLWSGACDEVTYGRFKGFWTLCTPETTITARVPLTEAVDDLVAVPGYAEAVLDPDNPVLGRAMDRPPRTTTTPLANAELARADYVILSGTLPDGKPGVGIWVDDRPVVDPNLVLQPGQRLRVHPNPVSGFSEVELDAGATTRSLNYYRERMGDLPLLGAARVGRALGVFRPSQTVQLESLVEGRESWQAWSAVVAWWALAPLAVLGAVRLRGRRPLWPFGVVAALVVVVVAASLGIPRYRVGLDVVVCVLAAVPLAAWVHGRWPWLSQRLALAEPEPTAEPESEPEPPDSPSSASASDA
ncbi:MAG: glycosyltransferase family 39 protein [Microthrixaceae bacterium]